MAAENLKSTPLTNADASPVVFNNPRVTDARLKVKVGTVEAAGGDAGSTYRLVRVSARDRIDRVELATDDLGTGVTLDVGLYDVTDGAVEDADFFASAVDVASAAVARTDISYQSGVRTINDVGQTLYEELGLSDTPANRERVFDVYATSGVAAATGTITVWVYYVADEA